MTVETGLAPHLRQGARAEDAALAHLRTQGLELLQRNFRGPTGELDLVMRQGQALVFVEVRYRRSQDFGGAVESIDTRKQTKLRRTAELFLQRHAGMQFDDCRFDVIAVCGDAPGLHIDWIQNAF